MLKLGMMSEAKIADHSMRIPDTMWICAVSYQSGFFTKITTHFFDSATQFGYLSTVDHLAVKTCRST